MHNLENRFEVCQAMMDGRKAAARVDRLTSSSITSALLLSFALSTAWYSTLSSLKFHRSHAALAHLTTATETLLKTFEKRWETCMQNQVKTGSSNQNHETIVWRHKAKGESSQVALGSSSDVNYVIVNSEPVHNNKSSSIAADHFRHCLTTSWHNCNQQQQKHCYDPKQFDFICTKITTEDLVNILWEDFLTPRPLWPLNQKINNGEHKNFAGFFVISWIQLNLVCGCLGRFYGWTRVQS